MPDSLHIAPHPEEQRPLAELREEFRQQHTDDLRSQMSKHPLGWGVIGDPKESRVNFTADEWAYEMLCRLDGQVEQDFGLKQVPQAMSVRIERLAKESIHHDSGTWPDGDGVVDHDAPACDLPRMTDDQICDYVDEAIKNG